MKTANSMLKAKTLRKNVIVNTVSHLLYMFVIWLMTLITPRIGGSVDAGVFTIVVSVSNICMAIASFGIETYIASDVKRKFTDTQYFYFGLTTTFVSFIVSIIICLAFGYHTTDMFWPIILYYIFTCTNSMVGIMNSCMIRINKNYILGYSLIIKSIIILILFIGGYFVTKNLTITFAILAIFSVLFFVIVDYPLFKINTGEKFKFSVSMYKLSLVLVMLVLPIFIYRLSFSTIVSFPRMVMEQNYPKEIVGYYGLMASISTVIQSALAPVLAQFAPKFAESYNKNNKKSFMKLLVQILLFIIGVTLLAFVCAIFLDKWLLGIIYPKDEGILEYAHFFKWIIVINGIQTIVSLLCTCLISTRKLIYVAATPAVGLITMFVSVYLLVPKNGMLGIVICEIISYGVVLVGSLVILLLVISNKNIKFINSKK